MFTIYVSLHQNEVATTNNSLEKERKDGKLKLDERLEELRKELSTEWSERLK
jgi:LPS sulfotransferase NodH